MEGAVLARRGELCKGKDLVGLVLMKVLDSVMSNVSLHSKTLSFSDAKMEM